MSIYTDETTNRLFTARAGSPVEVPSGEGVLIITRRHNLVGYDSAKSEAGLASEVELTEDGHNYVPGWHLDEVDGPEGHWVYMERYVLGEGRTFHGWLSSNSHKLLQAG